MKLIGCDRCKAIFPVGTRHTKLRIFDTTDDVIEDDAAPSFEGKELCPVCRSDLDAFLAGLGDVTEISTVAVKNLEPVTTGFDVDEAEEIPTHKRQAEKRTCESCGHKGFRKFDKSPTGWICWRCIDTQKRQLTAPEPETGESDPDPEPVPVPTRAPDPEPTPPAAAAPGVTARCQDCTRTWNLTGFILEKAAEMHELKHGHIVDVIEGAA